MGHGKESDTIAIIYIADYSIRTWENGIFLLGFKHEVQRVKNKRVKCEYALP